MTVVEESYVDTAVGMGDIELRVPADVRCLPFIRSLAATIATRADFTTDFVEDFRLAVDEAGAMLAASAWPGSELRCRFRVGTDSITLQATALSTVDLLPDPSALFGWRVLTTLTDTAKTRIEQIPGGYRVVIELTKRAAL
ncbi:ATP-binding protein [Actinocrispum wychmicini]|uniref:Serine/threonine-protein kinase RsbW n=1 Tax=Actinocrispum wychmicini TaxID=1213861 RepID=A0A4R2J797_9PSEU|nr:ATP-binding protein [Actinocrispum wychmicini]TCO52388.1 serine/threonine-protein kinase RsbW [Actinocrispum wychmicini]